MPFEVQMIKASEFLRLGVHGLIDLNASCDILQKIANACARRGICRALLDVRDVNSDLSNDEVVALANSLGAMGFTKATRVAVLHGNDRDAQARLFAACAISRGWNLRPFFDYEEATDWLAIAEEADELKGLGVGPGTPRNAAPKPPAPKSSAPKPPSNPPKKPPA